MAIHSSTLAWKIPWTEEPDRLYSPWGHKESHSLTHSLKLQDTKSIVKNQLHFCTVFSVEMISRFNKLDLVDTVPEELWMDAHNIVQEAVTKPSQRKREAVRRMEASQVLIAEYRRETKGKGERER